MATAGIKHGGGRGVWLAAALFLPLTVSGLANAQTSAPSTPSSQTQTVTHADLASAASARSAEQAAKARNVLKPPPKAGPVAVPPSAASSVTAPVMAPAVAAAAGAAASRGAATEVISHGRFENVPVFRPAGEPNATVLFLSDDDGWTPRAERMARALVDTGAIVAGIDTARLMANFTKDDGACVFPSGDLDNFGRFLEAYEKLPGYTPPILVGDGVGGTFAYAMLAQAKSETFSGALSVDFCPVLPMAKPLCQGEGVHFGRGITHTAGGAPMRLLPAPALGGAVAGDERPGGQSGSACAALFGSPRPRLCRARLERQLGGGRSGRQSRQSG